MLFLQENVSLIKEINDLRQELRVANAQVHNLQSALSLNKNKQAIQDTGEQFLYIFRIVSSEGRSPFLSLVNNFYCLCFILACLPGGTCYILIVEAESCRFLQFRSTASGLKDAFPCSCQRTVRAGLLLVYYILSILCSSSLQWTSVRPRCPEVESRDGKWKNHRNAAARNSISARPNPGEGASPELSGFSLFWSEIFLNWIWKEATKQSNTDMIQGCLMLLSWQDQKCHSRVDLHDPVLFH